MKHDFNEDCKVIKQILHENGYDIKYHNVYKDSVNINFIGILFSKLFKIKNKQKLTDFEGVTFIYLLSLSDWNSGIKVHVRNYNGVLKFKTSFRDNNYKTDKTVKLSNDITDLIKNEFLNMKYTF